MFKLVLDTKEANILKDVMEIFQNIIDECFLEISEKGLRIKALDRSHIVFVFLELDQGFFEVFNFGGKEKVAIDVEEFYKLLNLNLKEDVLLEIGRENAEEDLEVVFEGQDRRIFHLKDFKITYETREPPELKNEDRAEVEIVSELFRDQIIMMERYVEKVLFSLNQDKFIMEMEHEYVSGKMEWIHGEPHLKELRERGIKCLYSGSKLKDMVTKTVSDSLKLEFETDGVLRVTEEFNSGKLMFLLAPRIEGC